MRQQLQTDIINLWANIMTWAQFKAKYNKEYTAWQNRITLTCRKSTKHKDYAGRGISIHDDWVPVSYKHSDSRAAFLNFLQDVGPAPTPEHTIDRIDNDGHYVPENVRWVSMKENQRNRRNTIKVNGVPLIKMCEDLGKNYYLIYRRIFGQGLTPSEAFAK
jgi:hypothetical protein